MHDESLNSALKYTVHAREWEEREYSSNQFVFAAYYTGVGFNKRGALFFLPSPHLHTFKLGIDLIVLSCQAKQPVKEKA